MKKPAVFLDRDGTVNEQMGYINHISRFKILPGVPEAIRILNENNFYAIILSNQSGVARGYFPITLVEEVHERLKESLKESGAFIDGIFFCPHYPRGSLNKYCIECDCRKPGTGLLDQARELFDIDITGSYMIGDTISDMVFAQRCKIKGVMVKTGYGLGEIKHLLPSSAVEPQHIADDLLDAVRWIIEIEKPEGSIL
ncbi:MAG: HAD family hydrolase [Deltaproteobacteria bacterium]|nr:HAD family hydrolase [Deltaproteobacteria bacterium]